MTVKVSEIIPQESSMIVDKPGAENEVRKPKYSSESHKLFGAAIKSLKDGKDRKTWRSRIRAGTLHRDPLLRSICEKQSQQEDKPKRPPRMIDGRTVRTTRAIGDDKTNARGDDESDSDAHATKEERILKALREGVEFPTPLDQIRYPFLASASDRRF